MTLEEALAKRPLLLDGAMGSELAARGVGEGPTSAACLTHPEVVEGIHLDYLRAGARVILTNTFDANPSSLARHGAEGELDRICKAAVERARCAVDRHAQESGTKPGDYLIAGDIGPTGEFLEPLGDLSFDEAQRLFARVAALLAEAGADFIVLETFSALDECTAAVRGVLEATGLPVAASMTFASGPSGPRTMMGVAPEEAAERLAQAGAIVVGANCGSLAPAEFGEVLEAMSGPGLPLMLEPNAGAPQLVDGKTLFPLGPEEFAAEVAKVAARAALVGGCCGTTPAHIAALARALGEAPPREHGAP